MTATQIFPSLAHTEKRPSQEEMLEFVLAFEQMMTRYQAALHCLTTKLQIFQEDYRAKKGHCPIERFESRLKSPQSIGKKCQKQNIPLTLTDIASALHDIAGVRVICPYVKDIYTIRDLLVSQKDIRLISEKDYIDAPKANGYRSLHLIVEIDVPLCEGIVPIKAEIQLRTQSMHSWASLEHRLRYKSALTPANPSTVCDLHACAELLYLADLRMQSIAGELGLFQEQAEN